MIYVWSIVFLRPPWLAAVPLVAAVTYLTIRKFGALGDWRQVIEPKLLDALIARNAVVAGKGRRRFAAAVVAGLAALALAGPAVQRGGIGAFRNLDAMVLVIDLSHSTAAAGTIAEARAAAALIVQAASSRQIALIVYGGDAYLATPFTTDIDWLQTTIFDLDGQTVPDPGTDAARALALARQVLQREHVVQADVVLISDGGGIDGSAVQQAKALALAGYSLETVFVPAQADTVPIRASIEALVASVNGVSADTRNLAPVLKAVGSSPAVRLAQSEYRLLAWNDLGRVLIVAAMVPAILLFRRVR